MTPRPNEDFYAGKSVIYSITNRVTGDFYVGRTGRLKFRWAVHRSSLRGGYHHCEPLQAAWKEYGESAFEFSVVEVVDDSVDAVHVEQDYLDRLKPTYNVSASSTGGAPPGHWRHTPETLAKLTAKRRSRKTHYRSPEASAKSAVSLRLFWERGGPEADTRRAKIRAAMLGRKPSAESIEKTRAALLGRPKSPEHIEKLRGRKLSAEARAKISAARKRLYEDKEFAQRMLDVHRRPGARTKKAAQARAQYSAKRARGDYSRGFGSITVEAA